MTKEPAPTASSMRHVVLGKRSISSQVRRTELDVLLTRVKLATFPTDSMGTAHRRQRQHMSHFILAIVLSLQWLLYSSAQVPLARQRRMGGPFGFSS